jgi:hypothetical protein
MMLIFSEKPPNSLTLYPRSESDLEVHRRKRLNVSLRMAMTTPINQPRSTASNFPFQTFLPHCLIPSIRMDLPARRRDEISPGSPSKLYILFLS